MQNHDFTINRWSKPGEYRRDCGGAGRPGGAQGSAGGAGGAQGSAGGAGGAQGIAKVLAELAALKGLRRCWQSWRRSRDCGGAGRAGGAQGIAEVLAELAALKAQLAELTARL